MVQLDLDSVFPFLIFLSQILVIYDAFKRRCYALAIAFAHARVRALCGLVLIST